MARPSIYSAELCDAICERLATGESLVSICKDGAMPGLRTVMRWAADNEAFAVEYDLARAAQAEAMDDLIAKIAANAGSDPHAARVQLDAAKWRASKLAPKKYGDKILHAGADGVSEVQTAIQIAFVRLGEQQALQSIDQGESLLLEGSRG